MAKVKAKTAAVFNGLPVGSSIILDEKTAKKYESLKYLEIIEEIKSNQKSQSKKESAPKKPAKKKDSTKN